MGDKLPPPPVAGKRGKNTVTGLTVKPKNYLKDDLLRSSSLVNDGLMGLMRSTIDQRTINVLKVAA